MTIPIALHLEDPPQNHWIKSQWPRIRVHAGVKFRYLPPCVLAACAPRGRIGVRAPGTRHTVLCFCDSESRGW